MFTKPSITSAHPASHIPHHSHIQLLKHHDHLSLRFCESRSHYMEPRTSLAGVCPQPGTRNLCHRSYTHVRFPRAVSSGKHTAVKSIGTKAKEGQGKQLWPTQKDEGMKVTLPKSWTPWAGSIAVQTSNGAPHLGTHMFLCECNWYWNKFLHLLNVGFKDWIFKVSKMSILSLLKLLTNQPHEYFKKHHVNGN